MVTIFMEDFSQMEGEEDIPKFLMCSLSIAFCISVYMIHFYSDKAQFGILGDKLRHFFIIKSGLVTFYFTESLLNKYNS